MPTRLNLSDARLRQFADAQAAQPTPALTDTNVLDVLAAVGDGSAARRTVDVAKAELTKPGLTRAQQFDLAKAGLTRREKADLAQLLDRSGWQMTPGARNFLEALTGRAALIDAFGPLTLTGDQKAGLAGYATPGDVIEAINLSTAPSGRLHLTDTKVIATADAAGKFLGPMLDVREGDLIRLRTRAADGKTSDWLTIQARGVEAADTRNAVVNLERIDLVAQTDGVELKHNTGRPLSEPGATLRFVNVRTGEKTDVQVTDTGSLPASFKVPGRAGDELRVSVSDGVNNVDHAAISGTLKVPGASSGGVGGVDLPDPAMHADERNPDGTARYKLERFTGPLFKEEPTAADVRQGAIGNCYFPAALAAVARANPQAIKDLIRQNADGTYTVRFFQYGDQTKPVEIQVDGDLYVRAWGGPIYGSSLGGPTTPREMELWYPLVEKAYAQWKGSYDTIGDGGSAGEVMSEVLGRPSSWGGFISAGAEERLFGRMKTDLERGLPVAAGTHGKHRAELYTNTGVYSNHAYSVLGVEEKDGQRFVTLRNPWGQSEYGHDGKNDGVFSLPMAEFTKLFANLYTLR